MSGRRILFGWLNGLLLAVAVYAQQGKPPPTAQTNGLIENIVTGYQLGNAVGLVRTLSPLVGRWNDSQLQAGDEKLQQRGLPPVRNLLGDARLLAFEQDLTAAIPAASPREIAWTLDAVRRRVDGLFTEAKKHPALSPDAVPPTTLDEFESLLWKLHVLDNRFSAAERLVGHSQPLAAKFRKSTSRSLSAEDREVLTADWDDLQDKLQQQRQRLKLRELELRVDRLAWATHVLTTTAVLKHRLAAAYVVALDGEILTEQLAAKEPGKSVESPRTVLERLGLLDEAIFHREQGRQAAGEELLTKSRLLYTGMHWWLRGRYGAGTTGFGMLKDESALSSPERMFALYMPREMPRPTDPRATDSLSPPAPSVDRRHHYLWQFETRDVRLTHEETGRFSYSTPTSYGKREVDGYVNNTFY